MLKALQQEHQILLQQKHHAPLSDSERAEVQRRHTIHVQQMQQVQQQQRLVLLTSISTQFECDSFFLLLTKRFRFTASEFEKELIRSAALQALEAFDLTVLLVVLVEFPS